MTTHNLSRIKGKGHTKLYNVWISMKQRCNNEKSQPYKYYGGRGIEVCKEWYDYEEFYRWALANGYTENLTLDRINNDGDYKPENCRWVSRVQQQNNRRSNHRLKFYNSDFTLAEWTRILGVRKDTLRCRLRRGWSIAKTLTTPVRRQANG